MSNDNRFLIRFTENNMQALLYVRKPAEPTETDGEALTPDLLRAVLRDGGVTEGLKEHLLTALCEPDSKLLETEVLVAEGKPQILGKSGYYEYFFDTVKEKTPLIREDGSADYSNMSILSNVREDDLLARYHPAIQGEDGVDVHGKVIPTVKVKELSPLRGRGFRRDEETNEYYATLSGKVEFTDGKIEIKTVHTINGDVTLITGKIKFYGDIVIEGNVESGVVIKAGKSLTVNGVVGAVDFFAGGDIIVKRGIVGAKKAQIVSRGSVYADFIEQADIDAKGCVKANVIMNSLIKSGERVVLTGKRGALLGGYTHGLMGIEATTIGNQSDLRTILHAGCEPVVYEKKQNLMEEERAVRTALSSVDGEITMLMKQEEYQGPLKHIKERLKDLRGQKRAIEAHLNHIQSEFEKLTWFLEKGENARIRVNGRIYVGTILGIDCSRLILVNGTSSVEYYKEYGEIQTNVLIQ